MKRTISKITIIGTGLLATTLCIGLIASSISAMVDPAASYCGSLGYEYFTGLTKKGERALCRLPNDQIVDAHNFLSGKVALEWSYCAIEGYEAKRVEDSEVCKDCTVCVLEDETEIEVTKLMGLDFRESWCGDGTCGTSEDVKNCPKDCLSGGIDEYCDGIRDGVCDPDCAVFGGNDPDCNLLWKKTYTELWGARKAENLSLLRTFRDTALRNSEVGREYTSLLYDSSAEVASLLLHNPSLAAQTGEVIGELLPGIESLNTKGTAAINRDTIKKVESLLDYFEAKASPRFKAAIIKLRKDIRKGEVLRQLGIAVNQ